MKIAILHMTLGLVNRGSEVSTDLIAKDLAKNHDVTLLHSGELEDKPYQTITVKAVSSAPNPAPQNIAQKLLFRLELNENSRKVAEFTHSCLPDLEKLKPDVLIPVNGPVQVNILKKHLPQIKQTVFGRAGIGYHDRKVLENKPDLFIALSPKAANWAKQHSTEETHIVYIPNPIDPEPFKKAKPATVNLEEPLVLTVSAFTDYKNVFQAIEAVSQTKASHLIIGSGEKEEPLRKYAKELEPDKHQILTNLSPHQLPLYYAASDVFCFTPDTQEAFGRVYLEAMSAGLPIVATDDDIRRKIIGKQGFYADPEDTKDIAKKLKKALKKDKIDYTKQLEPFLLKNVVSKLEKELENLLP